LVVGEEIPPIQEGPAQRRAQEVVVEEVVVVAETLVVADSSVEEEPPRIRTRSGRAVKKKEMRSICLFIYKLVFFHIF
jgi:hypothetical protein